MSKKKICKIVNMVAFGILLIGGLSFLLMGLFNFNLFATLFGAGAVATRIVYGLFGVAALTLFTTILWKAFMDKRPAKKPATKTNTNTNTTAQTKTA